MTTSCAVASQVDSLGCGLDNITMSGRLFDHIDLRVKNRAVAQKFYAKILPAIGFRVDKSGEEYGLFESEGGKPIEFFCFTEEADHQPNASRIAFWADSRVAVDKVAEAVRQAGGQNIEGPEVCVEYSPGYYAVFFEDPDGNKLEVCCRESACNPG
jgi:catechol 2,3-dioxygenase-like lactoylglutathione lyase family enzyme